MQRHRSSGAPAPGLAAPDAAELTIRTDKGPGRDTEAFEDHQTRDTRANNSAGSGRARQALRSIEGESKAARYLTRLAAQQTDDAEFAIVVAALYGDELRGFCKVIVKVLKARQAAT